jgi:hypothetical protein
VQEHPAIFLLRNDGQLKHLANIGGLADRKAEALLVLQDDPEFFQLLLMFDGVPNGEPRQYLLPR